MKIKQAVAEYLLEIEVRKFTPRTIKHYKLSLEMLQRYLKQTEVNDVEDISIVTIKSYSHFLSKKGNKATYINSLLKVAKSFIQYCFDEGYGGFNTKKNFKWVQEEKTVIRTFKPNQVKQMLLSCKGNDFVSLRDKAILSLLFETGIRCLELCSIKPEDIHEDFIIINGKNHKQRVVPITPLLKRL